MVDRDAARPPADPRALLICALASVLIVSSTGPGRLTPFAAYVPLAIAGSLSVGASFDAVRRRVVLGLPFVAVTAAVLALGAGWRLAVSVGLKGATSLVILSALAASTALPDLLWAMRRLGAPRAVSLVTAMMARYVDMLWEEFARMSRARLSRSGAPLSGVLLFQAHGAQIGMLLVRSWERAERIHNAMLSRGFTGMMPETVQRQFGGRDLAIAAAWIASFLTARLFL